jgi:hypothetical protein
MREGGGASRVACLKMERRGEKMGALFVLVEVSVEIPRLVTREVALQHSGFLPPFDFVVFRVKLSRGFERERAGGGDLITHGWPGISSI